MGWIGYRIFLPLFSFFCHSCLSDSGVYDGEKKRDVGHAFGSFFVFCFLFYYTTGGCLASYIFCSFFFDSPIPLLSFPPYLIPPFPLTYLWCPRRTLTMCFFSLLYQDFLPVTLVEELGAYERCEAML